MKFIMLFGPQAVGMMTIGHELEKNTLLKLFHNHMTIELLHPLFEFGDETWRLSTLFRQEIFKFSLKQKMNFDNKYFKTEELVTCIYEIQPKP